MRAVVSGFFFRLENRPTPRPPSPPMPAPMSSISEIFLQFRLKTCRLDEPTHDPAGNSRAGEKVGGFRRIPT